MQPNSSSRKHVANVFPHGSSPLSEEPSPPTSDGEVRLVDLVRFSRRHWRWVTLTSLVAGVLTAILAAALTPTEYEASAALLLTPNGISSEIQPPAMSIQGFQRLLESDAVIDETVNQLIDEGTLIKADRRLDIGEQLRTKIYVSRRSDVTTLAPVIELITRGASAEKAAAIANTWADVFLERSQQLQNYSINANIELVEAQYKKSDSSVMKLEEERLESEDAFEKRIAEIKVRWRRQIDEAKVQWDRKLVAFENETENLAALFQLETRNEIESHARIQGLVAASSPHPSNPSLDSGNSGGGPVNLSLEVRKQLFQIMTLRTQLAQTLPFLSLEKAISNDAFWQALLLSQNGLVDLETATRPSLLSQEINTVYIKLAEELSDLEIALEKMLQGNGDGVRRITAEIEASQRQRTAGLLKLYTERAQQYEERQMQQSRELAELSLKQTTELQILERQRDTLLLQLDRNLQNARSLFDQLAERSNQGEIARGAQSLPEMRLAAEAVPQHDPRSRRLVLKTIVGLFFGAMFGCLTAVLREVNEE